MNTLLVLAILHLTGGHRPQHISIDRVVAIIDSESVQAGVDPLLVATMVFHESGFNPQAVSPVGKDFGLMQLRPTGAGGGRSRAQLFDPKLNIHLGVTYLAEKLRKCGTLPRALGAYSSGSCRVNGYARRTVREYTKLLMLAMTVFA
jgi:soluble lytic murein transglycosylase-like protein